MGPVSIQAIACYHHCTPVLSLEMSLMYSNFALGHLDLVILNKPVELWQVEIIKVD